MGLAVVDKIVPEFSTMLARLDVQTRGLHADADQSWKQLLDGNITRDEYTRRLITVYGFEAPFEAACANTPGLGDVIDLRGRRRTRLVERDLVALGWTPEGVATLPCYTLVSFRDVAGALAWMYVVERATLLHDRVRRGLVAQLPELAVAIAYLSAYEQMATRRWAELGMALDRTCTTAGLRDHVVATTRDAFAHSLAWQRVHDLAIRPARLTAP
jgi:heme oxygenase